MTFDLWRSVPSVFSMITSLLVAVPSMADEITVAVAANFTAAAKEIGSAFTKASGHEVIYSFGSTGQLFTQIAQGAPFDVFLSADQERPTRAVHEGLAIAESQFTYAEGKLVLWSADPQRIDGTASALSDPSLTYLAIANPLTAPYGAAAMDVMQALNLEDILRPKLVEGKSITQTFQFVVTGNAPIGFVALSQLTERKGGSHWTIPDELYEPIRQDAVLLTSAAENDAARAYLNFLKSDEARRIIEAFGYGLGD